MSSKKILIMPNGQERAEQRSEEREQHERSSPSTHDTLALQTLLDIERALGRLENSVEGLERSTAKNATDLNEMGKRHDNKIHDLDNIAHTTKSFARLALACISGGVGGGALVEILRWLITGHW